MEEKKFTKDELHENTYELYQIDFLRKKLLEGNGGFSLRDIFYSIASYAGSEDAMENGAEYDTWAKNSQIKEMHTLSQFLNIEYQNRKYMADLLKPYPELAYAYIMDLTDIDLGRKDG